ncbi:hypothetical protein V1478_000298 [Vespula squamosa]|uniref:Uncharacterized protein n=1 Tax=Vespula squamosa TaxID=30214 RepID=A0ABD2C537_VESSQ
MQAWSLSRSTVVPVSLGRPDDGGAGGYRIDGRRKSGGDVEKFCPINDNESRSRTKGGRPHLRSRRKYSLRGLFQQLLIAYQEMEYRLEHLRFSVGFQKEVYDAQVNV